MSIKGLIKVISLLCFVLVILCLMGNRIAVAQTWTALPPYNFLWPLWSQTLSPVDLSTGLRTPLVDSLTSGTVLPAQPGLAWNPAFTYPYLLYNSSVGMQYYDIIYGFHSWPPVYNLTSAGLPIPLNLPVGYQFLSPTDPLWLQTNLPVANTAYIAQYPAWALDAYSLTLPPNLTGLDPWLASLIYPTPAFSSLLTAANILGY